MWNDKTGNLGDSNKYDEKFARYNVDVMTNIKMSFDSTIEYTKKLAQNIDDIANYKMFILCLNNALELLFKFMISNRNDFLLYLHENRDKVYKKYKKAKLDGYSSLGMFFEANPLENNLHTIGFSEACDILCYVYQIENFDELFFERCHELLKARNGLTHYSATLRKIDAISFSDMLRTSIDWFNREIKEYYIDNNINLILGEKKQADYYYKINDYELWHDISLIKDNTIKTEIFEDELCQQIMGFIIENSLIEVNPRDYEKIEELFFDQKNKSQKTNEMRQKFYEKYHMMLFADMLVDRGLATDSSPYSPIVLGQLDLDDKIYRYLIEKWPDEAEQKRILNISTCLYPSNDFYDCDY